MKDALGDLADFSKGELAKIATTKWLGPTIEAIQKSIAKSFAEDEVLRPVMTRSEIKRRFAMVSKIVIILRRDLGWSMPRIFDELDTALRAQLDGAPWNPEDRRKTWAGAGPSLSLVNTGEGDMAPDPSDVEGAQETETL